MDLDRELPVRASWLENNHRIAPSVRAYRIGPAKTYCGAIGRERVAVYIFNPAKMTLAICGKAARREKWAVAVLPRQCKSILTLQKGVVACIAQARPLSHQRRPCLRHRKPRLVPV